MTCLRLDNVSLSFADKRVFSQLNLRVGSGEIVCVETGVLDGGSSLLKISAGLCAPTEGNVSVDGLAIKDMTEQARFKATCMAFEAGGLLSIFTNYNNIAFPMLYHTSMTKAAIASYIEPLAEALQISELLPLEPHQLNDVQTRMMNLLRAMVFRPKLILLDEVQSGMSESMRDNMLHVLLKEQQQHGYAVVMTVTAGDRTDFADRVLAIRDHKLEDAQ
ncbi:ATP-binding cassette domain-containing protein [Alteromonas lipolytica]|uniref:ABC transporter domain-containing protein n=1 Tax=Alteromonas lipolytica TaxID=1856405 RepID=A0A1E8F9J5_9ALTE|nr:ATP-binding cassette domain-containing protein [Alteromonas lipolytica]OFI32456.1 hypothetical protein BFC17_07005 [Alteromonas lipolytica]GGF79497.1 hypothetical protein GCM10011338_34810 [Alteromonas lipolytica]